jgi:uncharacterized membrane protein YuzA (DUF378 family)
MDTATRDSQVMYWEKKLYKLAIVLLIVGALNWLLIGLFKLNLVEALFGKSVIARTIYVLVGLAAIGIMCNRDTYLPFLGETVLPCSAIPNRVPPGATKEIRVQVPAGAKILYWAAEPALEELKTLPDWRAAYGKYENAGVATADDTGVGILRVRLPQAYTVPFKGRLEPHVHFRICGDNGMLGRVKTVFVKDERVEGFYA